MSGACNRYKHDITLNFLKICGVLNLLYKLYRETMEFFLDGTEISLNLTNSGSLTNH